MNTKSLVSRVTFLSAALVALVILRIPRTTSRSGAEQVDNAGTYGVDISADHGNSGELYKQSYALIVGVSNYKAWPRLDGAKRDVIEVEEVLKKHGFKVRVIMDPTRVEFDRAISDFKRNNDQSNPSRFLFYFSGHGFTQRAGAGIELGYILPSDAPLPDRDSGGFTDRV